MLKHLDLFSGIGGFSLGLESAGLVETVAFCDFDKYCQQVLNKNFPGVPVYGDVKELNYDKLKADGINQIDIITGGYPCQPFSVAGRKKGEQDPRHVWPEMFRLIKELRPTWVIGENVGGHIKLGLDTVLENLESEGYSARTFSISASSVGANHKRERVWIVANSRRSIGREQSSRNSEGIGLWSFETSEWSTDTNQITRSSEGAEIMADSESISSDGGEYREHSEKRKAEGQIRREGCHDCDATNSNSSRLEEQWRSFTTEEENETSQCGRWWDIEPDVGRVANGIPKRVDRLKCLGNSVVPQIPYVIGLAIKETIENEQSIRND
jgi:DNA (cytosine-5)-methyltransferase 1